MLRMSRLPAQIPGPREIRPFIRDLNAWTSQEVFVGPYLDNAEVGRGCWRQKDHLPVALDQARAGCCVVVWGGSKRQ